MLFNLQLTCMALMICAAVSVLYINKVGNDVDGNGRIMIEDEDTDHGEFNIAGSRAAAGWTLFVSCAYLFYNVSVFSIHKYCPEFNLTWKSIIRTVYSIIVSQCITI